MSGILEDHILPLHCPKCGAKIEKSTAWLKDNDELVCPCGNRQACAGRRKTAGVRG